ncbi:MAG: type II secretion system F family protein [Actinomycetes bacterium]
MSSIVLPLSIVGLVAGAIVLMVLLVGTQSRSANRKQLIRRVREYSETDPIELNASENSALARLRTSSSTKTAQILESRDWTNKLAAGLAAAGLTLKPEEWVLLCLATCAMGGLAMFMLAEASLAAAVLGATVGLLGPMAFLRVRTSRRQAEFVAELPDTLTALASGLSAGSSLAQAIDSIAQESDGVLGDEFRRAIIETRLGTSIPDALESVAVRMKCEDLGMVVMAIRLQSSHGGNLGDLLNTVATTLRERVQMKRHVAALSAEGRMSLWVLMSLPIVMLIFMAFARPEYFAFFIGTSAGLIMLTCGSIAMLIGYLWARTIVRIEV